MQIDLLIAVIINKLSLCFLDPSNLRVFKRAFNSSSRQVINNFVYITCIIYIYTQLLKELRKEFLFVSHCSPCNIPSAFFAKRPSLIEFSSRAKLVTRDKSASSRCLLLSETLCRNCSLLLFFFLIHATRCVASQCEYIYISPSFRLASLQQGGTQNDVHPAGIRDEEGKRGKEDERGN